MFNFAENSPGNTLKLCSPPIGSLGRRKQRTGPSPTPPNSIPKSQDNGFVTTGRMHRRHSSSDDRLACGKEEVSKSFCNLVQLGFAFESTNDDKEATLHW